MARLIAIGSITLGIFGGFQLGPPAVVRAKSISADVILSQLPRPTGSPQAVKLLCTANTY